MKTLTGSNAQAGLTFFFMVIPSLFAPLLGVWIDRVRRRPLLVWGNVASAFVVLPLVLVRDAGDVWLVWTVAFLYGVSFVVLPAALNGLLKELMPDDPAGRCQRVAADDQGGVPAVRAPGRRRSLRVDRRLAGGRHRRGQLPRRSPGDRHDPAA